MTFRPETPPTSLEEIALLSALIGLREGKKFVIDRAASKEDYELVRTMEVSIENAEFMVNKLKEERHG